MIWAYGQQRGLRFTLFRPFNWIGPRLDTLDIREGRQLARDHAVHLGTSCAATPISWSTAARRSAASPTSTTASTRSSGSSRTKAAAATAQIFNIGNPNGEASIRELAELLHAKFERHPLRDRFPPFAGIRDVESMSHYGKGYQDVTHRRPSIKNAMRMLGWKPVIPLEDSVERTLDWFLRDYIERLDAAPGSVGPGRVRPADRRSEGVVQQSAVSVSALGLARRRRHVSRHARTACRACSRRSRSTA